MRPRLSHRIRYQDLLCFLSLTYSTCVAFQCMHRPWWSDGRRSAGCSSRPAPPNGAARSWTRRQVNDTSDAMAFVPSTLSLKQLIRELEVRRVRFAPSASRQELEQLLDESTSLRNRQLSDIEEPSSEAPEERYERTRLSKRMRKDGSTENQQRNSALTTSSSSHVSDSPASDRLEERTRNLALAKSDLMNLSLVKLLTALNDRGIRYPPTAQRRDLVLLLSDALQQPEPTLEARDTSGSNSPQASTSQAVQSRLRPHKSDITHQLRRIDEARRRRRRRELRAHYMNLKMAPWERFVDSTQRRIQSIPRMAGGTYDNAFRHVRRLHRKANDYFSVDDDGVRDADFTYLYRDENLHGRVQSSDDHYYGVQEPPWLKQHSKGQQPSPTSRPACSDSFASQSSRRSSTAVTTSGLFTSTTPLTESQLTHRNRRSVRSHQRRPMSKVNDRISTSKRSRSEVITRRPLSLPPAGGVQMSVAPDTDMAANISPEYRSPADAERAPSKRPPQKRVYSPYSDHDEIGDGFDRLGSFVADVAERFMWGPDDDSDRSPDMKRTDERFEEKSDPTAYDSGYRHWKDRLEAQFDTFLGIHEDGLYYQRWAEKARNDTKNEGGRDPFSLARGVQHKRRGLSSGRTRRHEKPIWEEEGNLIALLFGRTQSGNSLLFEKLLDPTHGSLLYLLRAVFRSFMLVSSYACRWASVRGAVPQPVVVVGVLSAAVCASRRRRLVAVTAALALFRTLGELAHGYVYGNGGWDDDAEEN